MQSQKFDSFDFANSVFARFQRAPPTFTDVEFEMVRLVIAGGAAAWNEFISLPPHPSAQELESMLKKLFPPSSDTAKCITEIQSSFASIKPGTFLTALTLLQFKCRQLLTETSYLNEIPVLSSPGDEFIDDVYCTLEFESDCFDYWLSVRGAEDVEIAEETRHRRRFNDLKSVENIPGIGNVKHLVEALERHARKSNNLKSLDRVRNILQEIRPKSSFTSKWASEDRVGQAELYEACEKVLDDLKNYKEHSLPFLVKVNKRDAPDYYEVIKMPMDLGTMQKKLKNFQYNSKSEFASDLQLIWNNCLYYNSDPKSVYRIHAIEMSKKADILLKVVPNIQIRSREDLENDGYDSDYITYADSSAEVEETEPSTQQTMAKVDPVDKNGREAVSHQMDIEQKSGTDDYKWLNSMVSPIIEYLQSSLDPDNPFPSRLKDPVVLKLWEVIAEKVYQRQRNLKNLITTAEDEEINFFRSAEGMQSYYSTYQLYLIRRDCFNSGNFHELCDYDSVHDMTDVYHFPELFSDCCCIPDLNSPTPNFRDETDLGQVKSAYPDRLSTSRYSACIEEMRECKLIGERISDFIAGEQTDRDEYGDDIVDVHVKLLESPKDNLHSEALISEANAQHLLGRSIALLALYRGFDAIQKDVLEFFSEISSIYLERIARTFKQYFESYRNDLSTSELLLRTLHESGISDVKSLEFSAKIEPEFIHKRFTKIKKKLTHFYSTLIRENLDGEPETIADGDPTFLFGDFGGDILDDYLGLKALGLDVTSIPEKLWNPEKKEKASSTFRSNTGTLKTQATGYQSKASETNVFNVPKVFDPVNDVKHIVGIAKPYFEKKLSELRTTGDQQYLIEDEFIQKTRRGKKKTKKKAKKSRKKALETDGDNMVL